MFFRMRHFYFYNAEKWQEMPPHLGYSLMLPRVFKQMNDQPNMFCLKDPDGHPEPNTSNFISLQAIRGIPLWARGEMGTKSSLEYYAYDILIDWLELKGNAFSVEESTVYQKRFLLTKDEAQWQGHYIKARLIEDKRPSNEWYYVAVFRRSYIPPLMDVFDDLLIMGQLNFDLRDQLQPGNKSTNSDDLDTIFLTAIDSVYTVEDQLPVAKAQIEEIINSQGMEMLIQDWHRMIIFSLKSITELSLLREETWLKTFSSTLDRSSRLETTNQNILQGSSELRAQKKPLNIEIKFLSISLEIIFSLKKIHQKVIFSNLRHSIDRCFSNFLVTSEKAPLGDKGDRLSCLLYRRGSILEQLHLETLLHGDQMEPGRRQNLEPEEHQ